MKEKHKNKGNMPTEIIWRFLKKKERSCHETSTLKPPWLTRDRPGPVEPLACLQPRDQSAHLPRNAGYLAGLRVLQKPRLESLHCFLQLLRHVYCRWWYPVPGNSLICANKRPWSFPLPQSAGLTDARSEFIPG